MAKKVKRKSSSSRSKTQSSPRTSLAKNKELSPVMQIGVVFVIVAAMLLLWYVGQM